MSFINENLPQVLQYCARRMTTDPTTLFLYVRTAYDQYGNVLKHEYIAVPEGSAPVPFARMSTVLWFNPITQDIETLLPSQYFMQ